YKDSSCTYPWEFDEDIVTGAVTLYAKWEDANNPTPEKYSITYDMQGHGVAPAKVAAATALPNPLPSVEDAEGWHFVGWYLEDSYTTLAVAGKAITENTTLYAKWEEKKVTLEKYSITYDMQGHGTAPENIKEATALPNPLPPVEDVEGWHFVGWYLEDSYTTPAEAGKAITENTTLYAKWEEKKVTLEKYSITYDMQGHGVAPENIKEATALPNPLPPVEDVEGWHFVGWYLDEEFETLATAGKALTDNVTLYAKWLEKSVTPETVNIIFNSNGGSNVPNATATVGEKLKKPTDPVKEGYRFAGWFKDAACSETKEFNFNEEVITKGITLYAAWELVEYKV
ncbi:MAG: InlB B-repeat-containing protein, partial [Anaeroplasmataceae bacterium]|nr:InlB B-repeat-containing protein [Anaeroplasmataceae bacterium]